MARKTPSRLDKRREAEAVEAREKGSSRADGAGAKPKRKAAPARKRATREKAPQRKRLVWGIFSGSMKEEARFPYDQREAAEQKLEQLRSKSKKLYFLQPIKEAVGETSAAPPAAPRAPEPEEVVAVVETPEFEAELDEDLDEIAPEPFEQLPDEEEEDLVDEED